MSDTSSKKFSVGGSLLVGALIIAGAIFFKDAPVSPTTGAAQAISGDAAATVEGLLANLSGDGQANNDQLIEAISQLIDSEVEKAVSAAVDDNQPAPAARPAAVTEDDHILGDVDAPITIIEYSDYDCPFCGRFHETMKTVLEENDQVRWIYRHFPLESIHPAARLDAIAAECVAQIAGNQAFWDFSDILLADTSADVDLASTAVSVGASAREFDACLSDRTTEGLVNDDINDAYALGVQGTPYTVIMGPEDQVIPLSGAQPLSVVRQVLSSL